MADTALNNRSMGTRSAPGPRLALRVRAAVSLGAIALAMLGLVARLAYLQIHDARFYSRLAAQQQIVDRKLSAQRGKIYDRKGRLLASSVRAWSVFADPQSIGDAEATAALLSHALEVPINTVRRRLLRDSSFAWIKRQVTEEEAARVRALDLDGVHMRQESKRVYPQGRVAAHVIGFTDIDGRGLAGTERAMDALLRGKPGMEKVRCDGGRRIIRSDLDRLEVAPFHGFDVSLALDAYIQNIVEEELATAVETHEPESAVALVLDPSDGSVLAMASWPSFDPQDPTARPVANQRNIAICDAYEMGSVFKPVTVGLALDEGLVEPETEFDCHNGEWRLGNRRLHDAHEYGILPVSNVLAHSSNIGVAQIGLMLGVDAFYRGVSRFGFGSATGIALPGEAGGILRPARNWSDYSLVSVSFGQEIAVTPLAMARAFAAFANGGALLQPRIVQSVVRSHDGAVAYSAGEPIPVGTAIAAGPAAQVLDMLRLVVTEGTGRNAKLPEYPIAGKTGTGQLLREDGKGYSDSRYVSSFIGMAPAPDCRIVVLVTLKAPSKNGYYGGVVAAPAVRRIVHRTLSYMEVPPAPEPVRLASGESQ